MTLFYQILLTLEIIFGVGTLFKAFEMEDSAKDTFMVWGYAMLFANMAALPAAFALKYIWGW